MVFRHFYSECMAHIASTDENHGSFGCAKLGRSEQGELIFHPSTDLGIDHDGNSSEVEERN